MDQNRMKQQANKHRSERHIKEGDWVFLRLQPYKQSTLQQKKNLKLALKLIGQPRYFTRLKRWLMSYTFLLTFISFIMYTS